MLSAKTSIGWVSTLALAVAAVPSVAPAADRSMHPIANDPVTTDSGRVAGTELDSGVRAYLGIPFAEAPVGPLRWAAPKPARWTGVVNADRRGPACIQVLRPHDINHYFGEEPTSEDCLYMNVWSPKGATATSKLPVVVFIYGGGFTIGSSGMANYDGEAMAKAGAVFVNFNYRVGAMGFLAHPELTAEQGGHSGNYGIMDQQAALRWIHDNIDKFGGDPSKVVIMGQSAGAGSVIAQIFSPGGKGLFRGAVMSSGCNYKSDWPTLADAERIGTTVQERLKAANLAAMRNVPADKILAIQSETQVGAAVQGVRINGPIVDGAVIPAQKAQLLGEKRVNAVPVIASYNANDLSFGFDPIRSAKTVAEYQAGAQKIYGAEAAAFLKLYPVTSDADVPRVAAVAATEGGLQAAARYCAVEQAKLGEATYIDEYTRVHPYVPGLHLADQPVGAYHTADIPYWFGTQDKYNSLRATRNWTAWDRTLSKQMMEALIAFANTGSPSTPAMPWPAWTAKAERKLEFGDAVTTVTFDKARSDWVAAHPVAAPAMSSRPAAPRD